LNTGRRVTDGLNRFVRCTRRLEPAGRIKSPAGAAGGKIQQRVAPPSRYSIPGSGKEDSERVGSRKRNQQRPFSFYPLLVINRSSSSHERDPADSTKNTPQVEPPSADQYRESNVGRSSNVSSLKRNMKPKAAGFVTAAWLLVFFSFGESLPAEVEALQWQTGRVLAAGLSGHGANPASMNNRARKGDIWWTYCVSARELTYSVVSRESPAKTGLAVDSEIRFFIDKTRMQVRGHEGERHTLRILRQSKAKTCS
jgi:hypothetical protein